MMKNTPLAGPTLVLLALLFALSPCSAQVPPWWLHVPGDGTANQHEIQALWAQQAGPFVLGSLQLSDGSTWILRGELVPAPGLAVAPPPPAVFGLRIEGSLAAAGDTLTIAYTFASHAGTEEGTTYLWMRGAEVAGREQTYTLIEADRGATLTAVVTPAASTGAVGTAQSVDAAVDEWEIPGNPIPDPPPGTTEPVWRIPAEWDAVLEKTHPRGPGPINGPHPDEGSYLQVGNTDSHTTKADAWNPQGSVGASLAWSSIDVVIAGLATGDPVYATKAEAFLQRFTGPAPPTYLWAWLTAAVLGDHFKSQIDPATFAGAAAVIRGQLDAHRVKPAGTGWHGLDWEEWTQSSGAHGFAWALLVFAEDTPEWRPLWDWFGHVWFMRYAPLNWQKTYGPDGGSHPQQNYLASNTGAYLYHLHLSMSVATGLDTFTNVLDGGYYGHMLEMAWQRRLPSGQDISWGCQANSFYVPTYWQNMPGFPHAHALSYQIKHPVGSHLAWQDGFKSSKALNGFSLPWSAFAPTSAPPVVEGDLEWRCATFGMHRTGWTENDAVVSWHRGDYLLGHHRFIAPGEFVVFDDCCWLVGRPRHYGFGWQAEFYHRNPLYNGMRFWGPGDQSSSESYPFYISPGVMKTLPYTDDGGPNLTGVNPYTYRPAQTAPFSADPWEDFNSRRRQFVHSSSLGYGPGWESIDWGPSFQSWSDGTELLFRAKVNSRPTRVERWVRTLAFGDGWVVVLDDPRPLADVTSAWDLHLHGTPVLDNGAWHLKRNGVLVSAQNGWPHVAQPAKRRAGNNLTISGHLWIRKLLGDGTWEVGPTPTSGVRMFPHPGQTELDDGKGPDDWASTRLRLADTSGVLIHVLSTSPVEIPSSLSTFPGAWEISVGGKVVRINKTTYTVTMP